MIIGIPASWNTFRVGTVAALHRPPTETVMSPATISRAWLTAAPGSHASSLVTSSTRRPRTPPAWLASSTAIRYAGTMLVPMGALLPVNGMSAPSRCGGGDGGADLCVVEAAGSPDRVEGEFDRVVGLHRERSGRFAGDLLVPVGPPGRLRIELCQRQCPTVDRLRLVRGERSEQLGIGTGVRQHDLSRVP